MTQHGSVYDMSPSDSELIDAEFAASALGMSLCGARRLWSDKVPVLRIGTHRFVRRIDFDQFVWGDLARELGIKK